MRLFKSILFASLMVLGLFLTAKAFARPEYALQYRMVTCNSCHASPFGGGPRNVAGKMFASRFSSPSPLSQQSWVAADVRGISYYPKGGTKSRQGSALMTSTVSTIVPVKTNEDGSTLTAVGSYSLGVVQQGPRDLYVQWVTPASEQGQKVIQFGRMNAPFGLITDEHRTYTRLLTKTGIFDYEYGGSISGDFQSVHWDFALTNGLTTGGEFNANSPAQEDATAAAFLNLRWMPEWPIMLGASVGYHDRMPQHRDPYAIAAYTGLVLDTLTNNILNGSIFFEGVYAENWSNSSLNNNINRYFISQADTTYTEAVRFAPALAWNAQMNINFLTTWVAQYKLDSLTFDPKYVGDRYLRHGVGVKKFIDSNIVAFARYEFADVGRADVKDTNVYAAQDAFWMMLQLWL